MNITMAYSPKLHVAAYLPPLYERTLRWREAPAGDRISPDDRKQFLKTGFKTRPGMAIWDTVRELEHILKAGLGKSLKHFQLPHDFKFHSMPEGHVRYWFQGKWYRAEGRQHDRAPDPNEQLKSSSSTNRPTTQPTSQPANQPTSQLARGQQEMPLDMPWEDIPVLLLSLDQKQSQWSACHFLADAEKGLGISCWFRGDKFHRSWRDFQWAASKADGNFHWTTLQLNYIVNVSHNPYSVGTFATKRKELWLEWHQLFPIHSLTFSTLANNISLDARVPPPTGLHGLQELYQTQLLDDDMNENSGKFMKQCAWYDILLHIHKYDHKWHSRKHQMEEMAKLLMGHGNESKAVLKALSEVSLKPDSEDTSKEAYKSKLRHLRKTAGNCLLLAPQLMTNQNLLNARIMLMAGKAMWSEQTLWGLNKVTPDQDREFAVKYAGGLGDEMVKKMWIDSVFDARELQRIGMQTMVGEPFIDVSQSTGLGPNNRVEGVPLDKVPERLMSFLLHFTEARLWSYAWQQFAYPEAFAGLLSTMHAVDTLEHARELWTAATDAEANASVYFGAWSLRQEVYWLSWTLVQFVLRWLAHENFKTSESLLGFLSQLFHRIGDTKAIEESHRIGRESETKVGCKPHKTLNAEEFYARLQRDQQPLHDRGIPYIQTNNNVAYQPQKFGQLPKTGLGKWEQIHATSSVMKTPAFLESLKKTVMHGRYTKKTPASGRTSITAAQALVHLHKKHLFHKAGCAWQASCCVPHTFICKASQAEVEEPSKEVFLVLLEGTYACRCWPAKCLDQEGKKRIYCLDTKEKWVWLIITDASEWRFIPTKWVHNTHQPLRFGHIAAEALHEHSFDVPLVAEALVQVGHREKKSQRQKMCTLLDKGQTTQNSKAKANIPTSNPHKVETDFMNELLHGHPLQDEYLVRLARLHRKQNERSNRCKAHKQVDNCDDVEPSSSEEEVNGNSMERILTYAALDNLDDKNKMEAKQSMKKTTEALSGISGIKHMARDLTRTMRDDIFKPRGGTTRKSGPKIRCSLGSEWTYRYIPGHEKSMVNLPEDCYSIRLEHPPGRHQWVARFKHPKLIEMQRRPTHSKTYTHPSNSSHLTEHQSFQIVVAWLWERYRTVCQLCKCKSRPTPIWVEEALAECTACKEGSVCTFMTTRCEEIAPEALFFAFPN